MRKRPLPRDMRTGSDPDCCLDISRNGNGCTRVRDHAGQHCNHFGGEWWGASKRKPAAGKRARRG